MSSNSSCHIKICIGKDKSTGNYRYTVLSIVMSDNVTERVLSNRWRDRRADGRSDGRTDGITDKPHMWRFVSLVPDFTHFTFPEAKFFAKTNTDNNKRHKGTLWRNVPNIFYYMYALFWTPFAFLYWYSAGSGNLQKPKTVLVKEWLIDCLPFICCEVKSYEKAFYWLPITWLTESTCLKNNYIP